MRRPRPPERVKKRLLTGVVDENLEALDGRPRGSIRRARAARVARVRRIGSIASVVVAAGLATAAVLSGDRDQAPAPGRDELSQAVPPPVARPLGPKPIPSDPGPPDVASVLAHGQGLPDGIPLGVRRIAVDPGHGGRDGGTSMGYGLLEKDLTLDVAFRLERLLAATGFEVVLTRRSDVAVSLRDRATIANTARADLFVSIHVNWLPDRTARGIETYYLGATDDPFLVRLAAAENRDSDYTLADVRELLEGLYADVRRDESRRLAESLHANLAETLRRENPRIVARGVMRAPFAVLVATEMPAALAEVACLSNDHEARLLSQPRYRQRIAEALLHGIVTYAEDVAASAAAGS